jgi:hypothetical protein
LATRAPLRQQRGQIGAHLMTGGDVVLMDLLVIVEIVEHVVLGGARPAEHRCRIRPRKAEIFTG